MVASMKFARPPGGGVGGSAAEGSTWVTSIVSPQVCREQAYYLALEKALLLYLTLILKGGF